MLKIIIDTNVLVSALLKPLSNPALILSLIMRRQLKLCLSDDDILTEYKKVLGYGKFKHLNQDEIKGLLDQFQKDALWVTPSVYVKAIKSHPADNKFLECALEAMADFLITGNRKHFNFKTFPHITS